MSNKMRVRYSAPEEDEHPILQALFDARPDVEAPDSTTLSRIFEDALQESGACPAGRRRDLAGTRLLLSAGACICAAAGLLLLRSMAAEPRAPVSFISPGGESKLMASRSTRQIIGPTVAASSVVCERRLHSNEMAAPERRAERTIARPIQVAVMTTFAIYSCTPQTEERVDSDWSDDESLLISVVSADTTGSDESQRLSVDHFEVVASHYASCADQPFTKQIPSLAHIVEIGVGAATELTADLTGTEDRSIQVSMSAVSLPDYNAI